MIDQKEGETELTVKIYYDDMVRYLFWRLFGNWYEIF